MSVVDNAAGAVKNLPKGVWIGALGLGAGLGVIVLIKNRDKSATVPTTAGADDALNYQQGSLTPSPYSGDYGGGGLGSSVVAGDPADSDNPNVALTGGGVISLSGLIDAFSLLGGGMYGGAVDRLPTTATPLPTGGDAGGAPAYLPPVTSVPVAQAASAPTAPTPGTPAASPQVNAAAWSAGLATQVQDQVAAERSRARAAGYPNESPSGYYRVVLKGKNNSERWHYYYPNDSRKVKVAG